ncbi:hypothetical protein ACKX2L_06500 [Lachnospiraceae bacterium YH-ros2228]
MARTMVKVTFDYDNNNFPFGEYKTPGLSDYAGTFSSVMDRMSEQEKEDAFQFTGKASKDDYTFSDGHRFAGTIRF